MLMLLCPAVGWPEAAGVFFFLTPDLARRSLQFLLASRLLLSRGPSLAFFLASLSVSFFQLPVLGAAFTTVYADHGSLVFSSASSAPFFVSIWFSGLSTFGPPSLFAERS